MRQCGRAAWNPQRPTPARGCRAGSPQDLPGLRRFYGGFDIAHTSDHSFKPANELLLRVIRRYQLGDRLPALGYYDRLTRLADVVHQGEAAGFEFSCSDLLHGQIITYMVIYL